MQINDFSGGINTRVHPSLLTPIESVEMCNVDNSSKILKSVNEPLFIEGSPSIFGYFYGFRDIWLSSAGQRSYVEYSGVLYWTEITGRPKKFDGNSEYNLGIEPPIEALILTQSDIIGTPSSTPTCTETSPVGDGISDSTVSLTYCYTYYDSATGRESLPSTSSTEIELTANNDVTLGNITASTDPVVDKIKIYRIGDGIATMTLVTTVNNTSDDVVDSSPTEELDILIVLRDAGISGDPEVLQYIYTYYNSEKDIESVPSPVSLELELEANKEVIVSNLVISSDVQVDTIRLYRIGDGATEYTLMDEYPNENSPILDIKPTIDADGRLLDSATNYPPPVEGRFLVEAYGILFMAVGSDLYFSTKSKPDYFPSTNVIKFSKDITGLFPVPNGILVFSLGSTELLLGTEEGNFSTLPVSDEQGCLSHYSCKLVKNTPTWISYDGICNYSSGVIKVISNDKLGKVLLDTVNSAVYDGRYWMSLIDGSLLVMDTRFNNLTFKEYCYTDKIDNLLTYNNILYGRQGDKLVNLLGGSIPVSMTYKSPKFTEGDYTNYKSYDNIYIRAKSGDDNGLEVKMYIDDELDATHTLIGDKIFDIKPPATEQKGSSIQFVITGVGELYEINYKVLGRSNGR